jgi:hypothetical protein
VSDDESEIPRSSFQSQSINAEELEKLVDETEDSED